jgi:hypothetical protein
MPFVFAIVPRPCRSVFVVLCALSNAIPAPRFFSIPRTDDPAWQPAVCSGVHRSLGRRFCRQIQGVPDFSPSATRVTGPVPGEHRDMRTARLGGEYAGVTPLGRRRRASARERLDQTKNIAFPPQISFRLWPSGFKPGARRRVCQGRITFSVIDRVRSLGDAIRFYAHRRSITRNRSERTAVRLLSVPIAVIPGGNQTCHLGSPSLGCRKIRLISNRRE